ncbi:MAG: 4a-hydroxytetrahydrobiopterin dehydratase [Thermomicrobiales bacterium]|nr:4a-hydroxytetrahydrobiopterin dehydratase [Thermomicrobiales bacterium]
MPRLPLELIDIETSLARLPGWERVSVDGIDRIQRTYLFPDPAQAFSFTRSLGELAEHFEHHPSLLVERNSVTVAWWTFTLGALTQTDFTMAERTDRLYEAMAV